MGLVERNYLINSISPPIDFSLAERLVDEFISIEKRFIQRDWEPAELDGGQFAEILARIIYHLDSSILNLNKSFDECCKFIESDQSQHLILPRQNALHIVKVIRTIYKFRSQRGAVHISSNYLPNHMDSKLVIECTRWSFAETLRVFWVGDREKVAKAIRELLQFDVPSIGVFDSKILVQRTDLNTEEEILVLLHFAGEQGSSRNELGKNCKFSPSSITRGVQNLLSSSKREIIQLAGGNYRLTDLGSKRVREDLSDKLLLQ
jgi:hypothetical protein